MPTIKECVDVFISSQAENNWERETVERWLDATHSGDLDVALLTADESELDNAGKEESGRLAFLKSKTVTFIRQYFDERPEVVRLLDNLFATFGLEDDASRREKYLKFQNLYDRDEIEVLLLKRLQPKTGRSRYTRSMIAEEFTTSVATVNKYIQAMYPSAEPDMAVRVLGREIQLDPARSTNVPESTTHPVFLPLNMVELYTLVSLLMNNVDRDVEGRILQKVLRDIYDQTTGYARQRLNRLGNIRKATPDIPRLDKKHDIDVAIMFREKERLRAIVRYEEDGEEKGCSGLIERNLEDGRFIDVITGEELVSIPYRNIIEVKDE